MKANIKQLSIYINALKEGNNEAFIKLYEKTYQQLYFVAFILLEDEKKAQEILKNTYIELHKNFIFFEESNEFIQWSNQTVFNMCMNMLSKKEKNFFNDLKIVETENTFLSSANFNTISKQYLSLLSPLKPLLRATLIFKYFYYFDTKEISSIINCSEEVVKKHLNKVNLFFQTSIMNDTQSDYKLLITDYLTYVSNHNYLSANSAYDILIDCLLETNRNISSLEFHPALPLQTSKSNKKQIIATITCCIMICFLFIIFLKTILTPPIINKIYTEQLDSLFTNTSLNMYIDLKPSLTRIEEIYLISPSGSVKYHSLEEQNIYQFTIYENGLYTIFIKNTSKQSINHTFEISGIDRELPYITNFKYNESSFSVTLCDTISGIDLNAAYCEDESNNIIKPINIDLENNILTFAFPSSNLRIFILDNAGNISTSKIEITEN